MDKTLIINKIRNNKGEIENKFKISKIGLFGSYSEGKQTGNSDIDLVYELKEGAKLGLKDVYELEIFFKALFNKENIDLINLKYINPIIESEMIKTVIYV